MCPTLVGPTLNKRGRKKERNKQTTKTNNKNKQQKQTNNKQKETNKQRNKVKEKVAYKIWLHI